MASPERVSGISAAAAKARIWRSNRAGMRPGVVARRAHRVCDFVRFAYPRRQASQRVNMISARMRADQPANKRRFAARDEKPLGQEKAAKTTQPKQHPLISCRANFQLTVDRETRNVKSQIRAKQFSSTGAALEMSLTSVERASRLLLVQFVWRRK